MTISILLVEDHTIVRQGVRVLLDNEPDFNVVGEASSGLDAIQKIEKLRPNVVVLDIGIPDVNGLEVARRVHDVFPHVRVVILSMHSKEAYVVEALKRGASAYVLKGSAASDLVFAIHQAMLGERYLSPPLSEVAVEAYLVRAQTNDLDPFETLTAREREVMHLTAQGQSSTEVARKLGISHRTVEQHRASVLRKLSLQNHSDLIRYALSRGLIPMDGDR